MFRNFGWPEMILILAIVLIVFGVGKLPQVGSAIGKGIRAFKKAQSGEDEEESSDTKKAVAKKETRK
jgi:sec-independent protein translocase protein TatA